MKTLIRVAAAAFVTLAMVALTGCSSTDHNDADVGYARGMMMHHQQAIEMSDIVLAKTGVDPRVTTLATTIKQAQGPEIEKMKGWLKTWDEPELNPHGAHDDHDMSGMVSGEDIAKLKAASGAEVGPLFLQQMIAHHEGAVKMAQEHLEQGKNPEALALSKQVIADQTTEIDQMKKLLAS